MASAFSDSLMASEGWKHPTEISKTTKGMTMRFLPLVGTHMKAENQKRFFDIYGLVCKLQTEVQKIVIFGIATTRHANCTKFGRIVHINFRDKS